MREKHYLCAIYPFAESPQGWGGLIHTLDKGVTVRFGFDDRRTSQLIDKSRTKQRGCPMGCIIYYHRMQAARSVSNGDDYIFTSAWGFRRCSFRLVGQCEGLSIVERVTDRLHVFHFLCGSNFNETTNPKQESLGLNQQTKNE